MTKWALYLQNATFRKSFTGNLIKFYKKFEEPSICEKNLSMKINVGIRCLTYEFPYPGPNQKP